MKWLLTAFGGWLIVGLAMLLPFIVWIIVGMDPKMTADEREGFFRSAVILLMLWAAMLIGKVLS